MNKIRVRVAPSPTGDPHVGTAYIALFNYVFAKKNRGKYIIRIEDTDRARFSEESEDGILKYLKWLSLDWDEGPDIGGEYGPYKQSEREYIKYANQLLEKGTAYRCFCSSGRLQKLRDRQRGLKLAPGYDGKCRNLSKEEIEKNLSEGVPYTIRLKVLQGNTTVKDLLRGDVEFDNSKIDDQILIKSDGMPTYHLANVVDDHTMGITHVVRAEEWIPSTPKHILIYRAFGWKEPVWVHMPLLRNADKSKISKRKNAVSLEHYYKKGYLKDAMINFLALMGYRVGEDEIFSIQDMIDSFDFKKMHLGGPVFDVDKLNWLNREYMKRSDINFLISEMKERDFINFNNEYLERNRSFLNKLIDEVRNSSYTLEDLAKNIKKYMNSSIENFKMIENKDRANKIVDRENFRYVTEEFLNMLKNKEFNNLEDCKLFVKELMEKLDLKAGKIFPVVRMVTLGLLDGLEVSKILHIFPKEILITRIEAFLSV